MAKIGEKTWITEIRPAVLLKLLNSSPHDPLPTATQPSLWAMLFMKWMFKSQHYYMMQQI